MVTLVWAIILVAMYVENRSIAIRITTHAWMCVTLMFMSDVMEETNREKYKLMLRNILKSTCAVLITIAWINVMLASQRQYVI